MRKVYKQSQKTDQEQVVSLKEENLNLLETIAVVYESALQQEVDTYEAIAELYEMMLGGPVA